MAITHSEHTTLVASRPGIVWSAAVWASVVAGLVFAALEMALSWTVNGQSPWVPLHMIGAIALGPGAMAPPDTFDPTVIGTAVVLHMALAILYGVILAFIVARLDAEWATVVGALFGVVLYAVNFYAFTPAFPWFADARGWASILTHVVQSALMAYLYKAFVARRVERA